MIKETGIMEETSEQCAVPKEDQLKPVKDTLGRLLDEVKKVLEKAQRESPESAATKGLKVDVDALDSAYDGIPGLIAEHKKNLDGFSQKFVEAVKKHEQLKSLSNDQYNPGDDVRKAIDELREGVYNKKEKELLKALIESRKCLNSNNCIGNAEARKGWAKEEYEQYKDYPGKVSKDYQQKVNAWFTDLEALYTKAFEYINQQNYRALYAYRLEFEDVLEKVRRVPGIKAGVQQGRPIEVMQSELTESLRKWIYAAFEHFYWQDTWLKEKQEETKAKTTYENFKLLRRDDFVREAMDVSVEAQQVC